MIIPPQNKSEKTTCYYCGKSYFNHWVEKDKDGLFICYKCKKHQTKKGGKEMKHDKFQKGSGCFKCAECGRLTRNTGGGNVNDVYCKACIEKIEKENAEENGEAD